MNFASFQTALHRLCGKITSSMSFVLNAVLELGIIPIWWFLLVAQITAELRDGAMRLWKLSLLFWELKALCHRLDLIGEKSPTQTCSLGLDNRKVLMFVKSAKFRSQKKGRKGRLTHIYLRFSMHLFFGLSGSPWNWLWIIQESRSSCSSFTKIKLGWKRLGGKNGRVERRTDGSSIEKRGKSVSWKHGRWIVRGWMSDLDGGQGWMDGWSASGTPTWDNAARARF